MQLSVLVLNTGSFGMGGGNAGGGRGDGVVRVVAEVEVVDMIGIEGKGQVQRGLISIKVGYE